MKFQIVCSIAAAIALTSTVEGKITTKWGAKKVKNTKRRLEKVYGKGLVGLYHEETGKPMMERFAWDRRTESAVYATVGEFTFDAESVKSIFYGLADGLQYKEIVKYDMPESNCFYAAYDMVDTVNMLLKDVKDINKNRGQYQWFNVGLYDPLHFLGDFAVTYEFCSGYEYIELLSGIASLDYGQMAERLVTDALLIGFEGKAFYRQMRGTLGWYVPPEPVKCKEKDFTTRKDGYDEEGFNLCLEKNEEILIEIDEYSKVKEACISKDQAEKALAKAKKAAAKAEEKAAKAEKVARKMLDEFTADDFQSFQFSDDYGDEEEPSTDEFTEINEGESEDPDLEAAC